MNNLDAVVRMMGLLRQPAAVHKLGTARRQMLALMRDVAEARPCAVFLWLFDAPDRALDLAHYYDGVEGSDAPQALIRRRARLGPFDADWIASATAENWGIALTAQTELGAWCREQGIGPNECVFPVREPVSADNGQELSGVIQIVGAQPFPKEMRQIMPVLADGLGLMIADSREKRRLDALTRMERNVDPTQGADHCYRVAAQTLRDVIEAEICVVYRQWPDQGLRAVAASDDSFPLEGHIAAPDSLTHRALRMRKPVRLADLRDDWERERIFKTLAYDTNLYQRFDDRLPSRKCRAVMFARVVAAPDHPAAVIMLVNKNQSLARRFSVIEQHVLSDVCAFVGRILPSVETHRIMVRITDTVFSGQLTDPETGRKLFELIAETIPGTASVALSRLRTYGTAPELVHLGGEPWFSAENAPMKATDRVRPLACPSSGIAKAADTAQRYHYAAEIPHLDGEAALLALGLHRDNISRYEALVLTFATRELSQVLRGDRLVERAFEELYQIRHVVRSDLTGTVGYLHEAVNCYRICQQQDFDRAVVAQARFREALERAAEFAQRTHVLMEQARYLLGAIPRRALQLEAHSVGAIVREVIECLRPAAARHHLDVTFNNSVSQAVDAFQIDRDLVYILVFNLVDNAIKYSYRDHGVAVDLSSDGSKWKIEVIDLGGYIRPEDRTEIFHKFVRKPSGQRTPPGTGLGLAIAAEIVQAHGGRIQVDSVLVHDDPNGLARTCFLVTMPNELPPIVE